MSQNGQTSEADNPKRNHLLVAARVEAGLSRAELAARIKESMAAAGDSQTSVDGNLVAKWEEGKRHPRERFSRHICKVLKKTPAELGLLNKKELAAVAAVAATTPGASRAVGEDLESKSSERSPGVLPQELPIRTRYGPLWPMFALPAVLVACLWGGMAVLKVGPYAKAEIIVEGTVQRPSAAANPEAKSPAQSAHCPVTSSPFTKGPLMELMIQLATTKPACWTAELSPVNPGTTIRYLITYFNSSNKLEDNVVISTNLPPGVMLIPNTTNIFNSNYPHGTPDQANDVASGGVNIGNYGPGGGAYVEFDAALPLAGAFDCYWNEDKTVGIGQVWGPGNAINTRQIWHKGNQSHSTTTLDIYKAC